jgi:hypothetical protein
MGRQWLGCRVVISTPTGENILVGCGKDGFLAVTESV